MPRLGHHSDFTYTHVRTRRPCETDIMVKMLSPGFAPRRPSGYIRIGLVFFIVLGIYYVFGRDTSLPLGADTVPHQEPLSSVNDDYFENGLPEPDLADHSGHDGEKDEKQPPKAQSPNSAKPPPTNPTGKSSSTSPDRERHHPIDKLIFDAQQTFAALVSTESKTLEEAAQAYRKRRGRHPPPGFDAWYKFAASNNALVVEDFFDQIYHDLQPFWAMDPAHLRKESAAFEMSINIRNGKATTKNDWFWTDLWIDLIRTIQHLLPDMDLALNPMDEPRLVVPWEDVQKLMKDAAKTFKLPKAKTVVSDFQKLPDPKLIEPQIQIPKKKWEEDKHYWPIVRRACAPDSLAQTTPVQKSFEEPPTIDMSKADKHSFKGYVSNFTHSSELCHQPDLQGLEGIFINPLSTSATDKLFPLFGGSKLSVNNEILLPAAMYWSEEEKFTGGDDHGISWSNKEERVIWRGVATGGRNEPDNWRGFQRHRFAAMNNATTVSRVEKGEKPENFALPDEQYAVKAHAEGKLGEWIDGWSNVSFINLMCEPSQEDESCSYTGHYFRPTKGLSMAEQFDSKYVPDIDGNSFSGRYLAFLKSTSLPIKATVWREWHDSRLVAWKHFVPMDNRFGDYYGIMDYFLGFEGHGGHDKAAEKIASDGKEWAEKVLRREDMQIYVLRLLLEYARVVDERRESMGWVEDVLRNPSLEKSWKDWFW
ncbi:Beta-1,2-xylosyltransferase 1 [Paramyrothecium foliicola]|nr:Beta-1,2-xylosyltransferase 1 [Paramyrothecium foliicola]